MRTPIQIPGAAQGKALGFAVEVSGSVSRPQLNRLASQLLQVMEQTRPKKLHVIRFDMSIRISDAEQLNLEDLKPGGGDRGTSYMPVIKYAEEKDLGGLVILTDGECIRYRNTHVPVLWVLTGQRPFYFKPPCGQVILLEEME